MKTTKSYAPPTLEAITLKNDFCVATSNPWENDGTISDSKHDIIGDFS